MVPPRSPSKSAGVWVESICSGSHSMLHEGNKLTPESFQKEIDSLRKGDMLELLPHEFPGSVILNRSLIVDRQRATIWELKGPVMVVQSHGVVPRNLRIEIGRAS